MSQMTLWCKVTDRPIKGIDSKNELLWACHNRSGKMGENTPFGKMSQAKLHLFTYFQLLPLNDKNVKRWLL